MQNLDQFTKKVKGCHVCNPQSLRPIMKRPEALVPPNIENLPPELLVNVNTLPCEDVRMFTSVDKIHYSSTDDSDSHVDLFRANEVSLHLPNKESLWSSGITSISPNLSTFEMLSVREVERKVLHMTNEIQQECVCRVNRFYNKIIEDDKECFASNQNNNKTVNVHAPCFFPRSQTLSNDSNKPYKNYSPKEIDLGKPFAISKEEAALLSKTLGSSQAEKRVKENYLLESLFQKVLRYMKQIYPFLTREQKLTLVQLANQNDTTVFDQLKWFGYKSILARNENENDESVLFEEKMKNSLAMDLLDNTLLCSRIIQSCNLNFLNSKRGRMSYTRNFN